jgi:hypothetical protein
MSEKYFVKKNIPNNLHNSNHFMSQGKKSFRGSKNIINSASQEGAKTTEKINEAYRIDEISPKEEDIDHLHQFHLEKENRKNSLNLNKIPALSFINPFQNDNNFKRTISTRIPHPVKKEALIPIEANRVRNGIIKRRKASGERQPVKQIQSRYNSFSENKYHFMHRLSDSHKFGMYQLGNNDISKINSGPIDNFRDSNNLNNIKHLNSMKNSGEKIYTYRNSKNNTVNDIFSSSDSNSSPIEKNNYIENIVKNDKSENKNIDNRENRFLNNKNITNNSVNDFNLQNNIQLTKIEQNNNIIQNKNNDSSMFDMVFLPQYHSPSANMIRLIRQDITEDGKIIKQYENNKKEVIFPNSGLKKELFEDGYQVSYFKNKDIKQLYPDGKEVYLYAENNTVVTKFPNGLRVFKFSNGQIEKNFPDGTKIVNYADGTIRNVYNDGVEEVFFNDGSLQKVDKNGIITVEYSDGIQDTIYPDESKIRKYPDGRITKINSDGSVVEQ